MNLRLPRRRWQIGIMNDVNHDSLADLADLRRRLGNRAIVLIGMMGSGKSSIGRRLARTLGMPFTDADEAIEEAAGCAIPEIFATHGEEFFRNREEAVIARIIDDAPLVLATGGGAFISDQTRQLLLDKAVVIWLRADIDTLVERVGRKDNRPLLRGKDAKQVLEELSAKRNPYYAKAHLVVESHQAPHDRTVQGLIQNLEAHLQANDLRREAQQERHEPAN